jgi:hypothetical protein
MIGGSDKSGKSAGRDKRLAAALRENLRRRKTQARGRGAQPESGSRAKPPPREGESR